jgi:hypothetical protein
MTQLAIYALALSRRTGVPVKAMKCAWFDERDYFECNDLVSTTPQFAMRGWCLYVSMLGQRRPPRPRSVRIRVPTLTVGLLPCAICVGEGNSLLWEHMPAARDGNVF